MECNYLAMASLVEAIKRKYDPDDSDEVSAFKHVKEVAISQKPGDCDGVRS